MIAATDEGLVTVKFFMKYVAKTKILWAGVSVDQSLKVNRRS